jgi:hypothetical protein
MLLTKCHAKTSAARPICFACFRLAPFMGALTATHRPAPRGRAVALSDRLMPSQPS